MDVEALWKLDRVASVAISPDGSAAVCAVTTYSMEDNKGATSLWLLPTGSRAPRRLTRCGEKDAKPAWSPKGDRIVYEQAETRGQVVVLDGSQGPDPAP